MATELRKEDVQNVMVKFCNHVVPNEIEEYIDSMYNKKINIDCSNIEFEPRSSDAILIVGTYDISNAKALFSVRIFMQKEYLSDEISTEIRIYGTTEGHSYSKSFTMTDVDELLTVKMLNKSFGTFFTTYVLMDELATVKLKKVVPSESYRIYRDPNTTSVASLGIVFKNNSISFAWVRGRLEIVYFAEDCAQDVLQQLNINAIPSTEYYSGQSWLDPGPGWFIDQDNHTQGYRRAYRISKARTAGREFAQMTLYGHKVYVDANLLSGFIQQCPELVTTYQIVLDDKNKIEE